MEFLKMYTLTNKKKDIVRLSRQYFRFIVNYRIIKKLLFLANKMPHMVCKYHILLKVRAYTDTAHKKRKCQPRLVYQTNRLKRVQKIKTNKLVNIFFLWEVYYETAARQKTFYSSIGNDIAFCGYILM